MNILHRRRKAVGTPPCTLVYTGTTETRPTRITVTDYDQDTITVRDTTNGTECGVYRDSPTVSWINIDGLHDTELLRDIGRTFGIHPLVLEDIVNTQQRPRVQTFDDHIFVVAKMLHPANPSELPVEIQEEQISMIVGSRFVITFQEHPRDPFDPIRARLHAAAGRIRRAGADYLAYALLDTMVDAYFVVLEQFGDYLFSLETDVIQSSDRTALHSVYKAKQTLIAMRRHIWPFREVVNTLVRGDAAPGTGSSLITESTALYLRDLYDHVIQIIDILESYREMVGALVDLYMSNQGNRMNEVMKVLTIIATIFIPLTFIAGIYGMNFDPESSPWNMPELAWYWGYPAALAVMALIAGGMVLYFRRRRWL
jgi:magnesium transporter